MKSRMFLDWTEYFSSLYIKRFSGTLKILSTFSVRFVLQILVLERIKNVTESLDDKVYCWSHIGRRGCENHFHRFFEEPVVLDS